MLEFKKTEKSISSNVSGLLALIKIRKNKKVFGLPLSNILILIEK